MPLVLRTNIVGRQSHFPGCYIYSVSTLTSSLQGMGMEAPFNLPDLRGYVTVVLELLQIYIICFQ